MSGFVGYALKGLKAGATKVAQKISGQKKLTGKAINKMPVAKKLKETRDLQDDLVDYRTKLFKGPFVTEETKMVVKTKNPLSQYLRKQNMNMKKPLAKGGRVGLKAGTNPFKRKTNIDKIKETFAPKKRVNAKGGKLIGGQKNIDVAAPFGKITGEDFAKLRSKKTKKKVI